MTRTGQVYRTGPIGGNCRQIPPNTGGRWYADSEVVIGRLLMETVKTITVKFVRPDGSIIVVTLTFKVKQ